MYNLLIVDDDAQYAKSLASYFEEKAFHVTVVTNPLEAITVINEHFFDVAIFDLKMKELSGIQLVQVLERMGNNLLIYILTNSESIDDELSALDLNINGYLKKDLAPEVILKRIEIALKNDIADVRIKRRREKLFSKAERIEINLVSMEVYQGGKLVKLTRKEMELLILFLENKNTVFTREEIIDKAFFGSSKHTESRTVDVHIKRLRQKLKLISLISVHGLGYKWYGE